MMYNCNSFDLCAGCRHAHDLKFKLRKITNPSHYMHTTDQQLLRAFPEVCSSNLPSWCAATMVESAHWLLTQSSRLVVLPSVQWNLMACVVVKTSNFALQRYRDAGNIALVASLNIPGNPVALMHLFRPISMGYHMICPQLFDTYHEYREHYQDWITTHNPRERHFIRLDLARTPTVVDEQHQTDYNKFEAKSEPDYVTHLYLSVRGKPPDGMRH